MLDLDLELSGADEQVDAEVREPDITRHHKGANMTIV